MQLRSRRDALGFAGATMVMVLASGCATPGGEPGSSGPLSGLLDGIARRAAERITESDRQALLHLHERHLQALQRELSSASAVDTARVQQIRDALQAGTYQINAEAIADGMLSLERQLGR